MSDQPNATKKRRQRKRARAANEGAVYQRASDARWVACISVSERGRRTRKYFYGRTQAEALAKRDEARQAQRKGLPLPDDRLTVGRWLERWLTDHVAMSGVRPRTLRSYRELVDGHLAPELGRIGLTELTTDDVQCFVAKKRRTLSARTTSYLLTLLRMALKRAEAQGHVARNVATHATGPRAERKEVSPLSVEETRTLLAALEGERYAALFVVAASRGLRLGEVLALRWSSIILDGDAPTLRVDRTLQREGEGAERRWYLAPPKSQKSARTLALSSSVVAALRKHRAAQLEERLAAGPSWENHDLVFCTSTGGALDERNVRRAFYRVLVQAGLPRRRLHDLRHGHATQLLLSGENLKAVSAALGHSQISVTMDTYAHVVQALDERTSDKLERLLFGENAPASRPAAVN